MKKILILISSFLICQSSKAQLTLEHSYATNHTMTVINLEGDGQKYIGSDSATWNIQLYNTDHSLWKTIPIDTTGMNSIIYLGAASKHFFNSDDLIEIVIAYNSHYTGAATFHGIKILNESGTTLQDFPTGVGGYPVNVAGSWKFIVNFSTYVVPLLNYSTVYSAPGTYAGLKVNDHLAGGSSELYPNPIESAATLRYNLPGDIHSAQLAVYNSAGVLVRQSSITDKFSDITIARDDLPAGIYVYSIIGPSGTLSTSKFEIR